MTKVKNEIYEYLVCDLCYKEIDGIENHPDHIRMLVGKTKTGIQLWCLKHNVSIGRFIFSEDHETHVKGCVCNYCQQQVGQ